MERKNEEFRRLAMSGLNSNSVLSSATSRMVADMHAATTAADLREQQFHETIRENLVYLLIYFVLFMAAFFTIKLMRKVKESDDYVLDYEDDIVDKVSILFCTSTLATCFGAVLLLPMSIIANEVIILAPQSFYWKWLNSSLLHGLWNSIFLLSNMSLFIFIPIAHLIGESIGLPGYKKGIKARVIETCLVLLLIAICVFGMSYVISSVIDAGNPKSRSFLNIGDYHLPFLYSCISFIGVLFLLICTPFGLARLSTVISDLFMKTPNRQDIKEELETANLEESSLISRISVLEKQLPRHRKTGSQENLYRSCQSELETCYLKLQEITVLKSKLEIQSKRSTLYQNLFYPFIMILFIILNVCGIFMVIINTFNVIFGQLPTIRLSADQPEKMRTRTNNESIFSVMEIIQIIFEIILILYFMFASLVGFYSLPFFCKILPRYKSTAMRKIILNCMIFLIFSSALPVSSKILGLTRFDLLGRFGDLHWLTNVNVILIYNIGFTIATVVCLVKTTARTELYQRIVMLFQRTFKEKSVTSILMTSPTSRAAATATCSSSSTSSSSRNFKD